MYLGRFGKASFLYVFVFLLTALHLELLSYLFHAAWTWPYFGLENRTDPDLPIRLLLVADPQLIGEKNEMPLLGWISRWDSDRQDMIRNMTTLLTTYAYAPIPTSTFDLMTPHYYVPWLFHRYLGRTYRLAKYHAQPHLIVFLG